MKNTCETCAFRGANELGYIVCNKKLEAFPKIEYNCKEWRSKENTCETCLYHEPLGCVHREHTGEECVDKMGWQPKESKVESNPEKEYEEKKTNICVGACGCNCDCMCPEELEKLAIAEGKRQERERIEREVIKLNAYPNTSDKKIKKADVLRIIKSK